MLVSRAIAPDVTEESKKKKKKKKKKKMLPIATEVSIDLSHASTWGHCDVVGISIEGNVFLMKFVFPLYCLKYMFNYF